MDQIVMIMLRDGLRLASGQVAQSPHVVLAYCKVPEDWVDGSATPSADLWLKGAVLKEDKLEKLFAALYGPNWKNGNEDGSQYVVLAQGTRLLNPARSSERPWKDDDPKDPKMRFFHYVAVADGQLQRVTAAEL